MLNPLTKGCEALPASKAAVLGILLPCRRNFANLTSAGRLLAQIVMTAVNTIEAKPKRLRQLFYLLKTLARWMAESLFKQFALSHFAVKPRETAYSGLPASPSVPQKVPTCSSW
jgi:hypothetical protein